MITICPKMEIIFTQNLIVEEIESAEQKSYVPANLNVIPQSSATSRREDNSTN